MRLLRTGVRALVQVDLEVAEGEVHCPRVSASFALRLIDTAAKGC